MGASENLKLIEELQRAGRDGDYTRYGELLADDAVFRAAGVPGGIGRRQQGTGTDRRTAPSEHCRGHVRGQADVR